MNTEDRHRRKKKVAAPEDPFIGKQLSHYQFGQIVGHGAAGTVYKAIDLWTANFVAIKAIPSTNTIEIQSIQSEIKLLQKLKHPNIVRYQDSFFENGHLLIVTEFVENGSLQSIVKKFGKLQESLIFYYVIQVCIIVFFYFILTNFI